MGIDLGRLLEQHAVRGAARGRRRCAAPRRRSVSARSSSRGVRRLVREPAIDVPGEGELVERGRRRARRARVRAPRRRAPAAVRGLDARGGAALHELALDRVERRELVVPAGEGEDLVGDAEELGEEALEMRREIEEQRRLVLRVQRLGVGATRARAARRARSSAVSRNPTKWPSSRTRPVAAVEVLEREAVSESKRQRVAVRRGAQRSRYCSLSFTSFHCSASGGGSFLSVMDGQVLASSALSAVKASWPAGRSSSA